MAPTFQRFFRALLPLMVAVLPGCVSLEETAPPVAMLRTGTGHPATLEQGRIIYLTRCTKCHSAERVTRYSRSQWHEILPKMAEETKLSAAEDEAVRAYVMAVLNQGTGI